MARRNPRQQRRRRQQNPIGALQGGTDQAVLPQNPNHFLNRFPSFQDYTTRMAQRPNHTALTQAQYGSITPQQHAPNFGAPPGPADQTAPIPASAPYSNAPGAPQAFSPTMGNTYGNTFQSNPAGSWQSYSGPQPSGVAQGQFYSPEAHDTERFTYDTFANGQTYKPMPGAATGGPGNANYPFQGYAAPPANYGYFDQGAGWDFGNTNHTPMTWDQYAQVMAQPNIANDIQPYFRQTVAPQNSQDVWWANPVITDPGYYDPWVEERNLQQHFGQATPGNVAGDTALGLYNSPQGKLDYYRYLAHQAGIPGYAQLTGPLAPGYHSPNIGGTYGAT